VPPIANPIDLVAIKSRSKNPDEKYIRPEPIFAFSMDSPWGQCYQHFLQSLRTENTKYRYGLYLESFFSKPPARLPDAYSKGDIEAFIHSSRISTRNHGKPLKPAAGSVNFRLSAIASFYSYAATYTVDINGIQQMLLQKPSPATGIKRQRSEPAHRTISDDELSRLFAVIPLSGNGIRDRILFYSFLMLGRRRNELVHLRWGDIEETTFVERGHTRAGYRYSFIGKGRRQKVWAEMPQEVYDAITWLLVATDRLETTKPTDYIFVGMGNRNIADPNKPLTGASVLRLVKKYAALADVPADRVCVHLFRHLNAQERLKNGQTLVEIMQAMGHASMGTTHIYLQSLVTQADIGAPALAAKFGSLTGVK
jgi:integrase